MTTIRRFCCNDLLRFTFLNLDAVTYTMRVYMSSMAMEPQYFLVADAPGNRILAYIMGSADKDEYRYGHIIAVTFNSKYVTQQIIKNLVNQLEVIFDYIGAAYFVDLSVTASNSWEIKWFEELGYVIYKRRANFFFGKEDAFNMRKALSRDEEKKSLIPPRDKTSYAPDELYTVNDDDEVEDEDEH